MSSPEEQSPGQEEPEATTPRINLSGVRAIARDAFLTLAYLAALLLAAGSIRWPRAWLLVGLSLAVQTTYAKSTRYRLVPLIW